MQKPRTKSIQDYTPELLMATTVLALVGSIYLSKKTSSPAPVRYNLDIPKTTIKHMLDTGEVLGVKTDKLLLMVTLTDQ